MDSFVYDLGEQLRLVCSFNPVHPVACPIVAGTVIGVLLLTTIYLFRGETARAVPFTVPVPIELRESWKGEQVKETTLRVNGTNDIQCYCPATGRLLGMVKANTPSDIDKAITDSSRAQKEWAKTTWLQRKQVLLSLSKYILQNQDVIARAACLDSGKTRIDAALGEILVTVEKIAYVVKYGESALKPERRPVSLPLMMYKKAEVRYEPLGVVCACVSWNYPFHNFIGPIISSIFAGNGIVVKGSEQTAWSSQFFAQIVKSALEACGHSPDLVQSLTCWPETADYLTSHPGISHILFIGSRPVAHHVATAAAKTLVPLCIELGGKDAAIILDDVANLKSLSSILMRGVFQSSSQNCVGLERIIALPKVYDQLVEIMRERISKLRQGSALDQPGIDVGAMISDANFTRLESLVEEAVAGGARLLLGGSRFINPTFPQGHYFQPTLLVDVTSEMEIAQHECFAPICVLMKAENVDEAIEIANGTMYSLGASVFGRNKAALEKVTREIKCGMVSVNDFGVYYLNQSLPFGGVRGSGYGRFAGVEGLRSVCNQKAAVVDIFPSLIQTGIPPVVDYPIPDTEKGWGFVKGLIAFAYAHTYGGMVAGLAKLLGNM